jgi:hypothetical protein
MRGGLAVAAGGPAGTYDQSPVHARKPGAMPGALVTHQARQTGVLTAAHEQFWARARRRFGDAGGTRALVEVLLLHRDMPFPAVHAALEAVNSAGCGFHGFWPPGFTANGHPVSPELATLLHG